MVPEIDLPAIHPDVDYWLLRWARADNHDPELKRLGYIDRSLCFIGGGESQRGDDWQEQCESEIDSRNIAAMAAEVASLPELCRVAVECVYLGQHRHMRYIGDVAVIVIDNKWGPLIGLMERASDKLLIGMRKRNVL